MSKQKRTIWDDLLELGRELMNRINELLNPEKRRKPARVPVPVRNNQPLRDPYDDNH